MDENLVASIRKNLAFQSTAEIQQAYENPDKATRSAEELEAMRQLLAERSRYRNRLVFALAAAVMLGALGAAGAWWQEYPGELVIFVGVGTAVLAFVSCYIPNLFGQSLSR